MFILPFNNEPDLAIQQQLIRDQTLGTLFTSLGDFQANHIPFVLVTGPEYGEYGVLRAHLHKINPQARQLVSAADKNPEVLVTFMDTEAYVPPRYYVETKPSTGKVAPTWNFAAVHCYGKVTVYHENNKETREFLLSQLNQLVDEQEANSGSNWKVADAPEQHIDNQLQKIIGIEIQITRQEAKFKMSQEKGQGDLKGVVDGFSRDGNTGMSECIKHACERRASRKT